MSKKHIPGPWEFAPKLTASENHKGFFIRAEKANRTGKFAIAEVQPGDEDGCLGEANARLIAAAPELLEALKIAEQFMQIASDWNIDEAEINGEMKSTYDWLDVVNAAIAKAGGAA